MVINPKLGEMGVFEEEVICWVCRPSNGGTYGKQQQIDSWGDSNALVMDPVSYTVGQQHGGHLEFVVAVVDRTREEGGMNPTEVEMTDIK